MSLALAESDQLLSLAASRAAADRERLLAAVTELYRTTAAGAQPGGDAQALMTEVLLQLVREAETDIRRRLAERLADADWAPSALAHVLALDDIDIARPIIARSPLLQDEVLVQVLVTATLEHRIEVARRPGIGETVVEAVLHLDEGAVLAALAGNADAGVTLAQLGRLVAAARRHADVRAPLARHPRLNAELAEQLYLWIGQTLRRAVAARFQLDTVRLDALIAQTLVESRALPAHAVAPPLLRDPDREDADRRLVAKLHDAGQLRTGYLLKALRDRRLGLFCAALSRLGGFAFEQVRSVCLAGDEQQLAALCADVGLDRTVLPTVTKLVRDLGGLGRVAA